MEETKPKPFVFVLMPFHKDFDDVYEFGIRAGCDEAGAYCDRVNEQKFDEMILQRVYNQIAKADIIVAEMTGNNPNVFYETGYAHALNKRVILVAEDESGIPFDLRGYPYILYQGQIKKLKAELKDKVRWSIENPKDSLSSVDLNLEFVVNGVQVKDNPVIEVAVDEYIQSEQSYNGTFSLEISIHNPTDNVLHPTSFHISLIIPDILKTHASEYGHSPFRSTTQLPDGKYVYNMKQPPILFPESWETLEVNFSTGGKRLEVQSAEIILRFHSQLKPKNHPFTLKFCKGKLIKY